ncbi:MAG: MFS transporter [Solirubrobacterales bacterium]
MFEWASEARPAALTARLRSLGAEPSPRRRGAIAFKPVALLAGVLALQSADLAAVGAVGGQLESSLGIDHVQLGLLAAVAALVAAAATLPFGFLADRVNRVRVLAIAVATWAAAMVVAGLAGSFSALLLARLFLGVALAAAGPLLASLMGDLFPGAERARVYGYVLSGELIGAAVGFLVSGNVAALLSWRWAFWVLAPPALLLAWGLRRGLEEPRRGGQEAVAAGERIAQRIARRQGVEPDEEPLRISIRAAHPAGKPSATSSASAASWS